MFGSKQTTIDQWQIKYNVPKFLCEEEIARLRIKYAGKSIKYAICINDSEEVNTIMCVDFEVEKKKLDTSGELEVIGHELKKAKQKIANALRELEDAQEKMQSIECCLEKYIESEKAVSTIHSFVTLTRGAELCDVNNML